METKKSNCYDLVQKEFGKLLVFFGNEDPVSEYNRYLENGYSEEEFAQRMMERINEATNEMVHGAIPGRAINLTIAGYNALEAIFNMLRRAETSESFNQVLKIDRVVCSAFCCTQAYYLDLLVDNVSYDELFPTIHKILQLTNLAREEIAVLRSKSADPILRFIEILETTALEGFDADDSADCDQAWFLAIDLMTQLALMLDRQQLPYRFSAVMTGGKSEAASIRREFDSIVDAFGKSRLKSILKPEDVYFITSAIATFKDLLDITKAQKLPAFRDESLDAMGHIISSLVGLSWRFILDKYERKVMSGFEEAQAYLNVLNTMIGQVGELAAVIDRGLFRDRNRLVDNPNIKYLLATAEKIIKENKKEKGETTMGNNNWEELNEAVKKFREAFTYDEDKLTLYAAFKGDATAYMRYVDELDQFSAAVKKATIDKILDEEESEFFVTTLRIFRTLMAVSKEDYAKDMKAGPVALFHTTYAFATEAVFKAMSEQAGYLKMSLEEMEILYKELEKYHTIVGDRDYELNVSLAKACTSLDYEDLDTFYSMLCSVMHVLKYKITGEVQPASETMNTEPNEDECYGTVFDDMIEMLRGVSSHNFNSNDEKFENCINGLCAEIVDNMFHRPTDTSNLGFEQWLSSQVIGVSQELFMLRGKEHAQLLGQLCMMIADILELLVKAKYYPNIAQRKYHLPEFDIHALSVREIAKLKDTSLYLLNHLIYEIDEACGMDTAKEKAVCFIHISEFAHYGLTCAIRLAKVAGIKDTVNDLKADAKLSHDKPVITAQCEGEDDSDLGNYDFEDAHDQMLLYAKLRKEEQEKEEDQNEMEDWLMHNKEPMDHAVKTAEALKKTVASARKQVELIKSFGDSMKRTIKSVTPDEAAKTYEQEFQKLYRELRSKKGRK